MKRRLTGIIALILLSIYCVFTLSACGCAGEQPISFTNRFVKGFGESSLDNYFEELTYEINYQDDMYGYNISNGLNPEDFEFGVGTYKTTLKKLDDMPLEELKNNEVFAPNKNDKFYSYTTSFEMPVTYYVSGEEKSFVDKIDSVVYFLSQDMSFAPIYSSTTADYSVFSAVEGGFDVLTVKYQSTFVYSKNSYSLTLSGDGMKTTTTNHEYELKTLIDNAQLLFALRNLEVLEGSPRSVYVSSSAYKEQTDLAIYFEKSTTESTDGLMVNGTALTEDIKLDMLRFRVNSAKNSGNEQYVFIQSETSEGTLKNNAYMFKYVQPLVCYGTFEFMGSLEFTLKTITHA